MGKVVKLKTQPSFEDIPAMLNQWWKELERKPFGVKPVRIRHLVETAHAAGWTIDECYEALNLTWGFTENAFETALRRIADEQKETQRQVTNIHSVETTMKALDVSKKESLSLEENVKRLKKLKESKGTQG